MPLISLNGLRKFLAGLLAFCCVSSVLADEVSPVAVPASAGAMGAHLARGPGDLLVLSWLEPAGDGHALKFSTWGDGWSEPGEVIRGTDWFVNWADFPSVQPLTDSLWAAHWLQRSGDAPYAYDVMLALSADGGRNWRPIGSPHRDGTPTEHGFASLFARGDVLEGLWLDGRNTTGGHEHGHGGAMTLRYARISADGARQESGLLDGQVCDCCQTDVALTDQGPLAVYRDRGDGEIRDIARVRWLGDRWSEPAVVSDDGWQIAGCPVNGPAVDAAGQQAVVAWYTQGGGQPEVRVAWSSDGGVTFTPARIIDDAAPLGRVDVALDSSGIGWVSWMRELPGGGAHLLLRSVTPDGAMGHAWIVADNAASRPAGFPQLAMVDGRALLVWTDALRQPVGLSSALVTVQAGERLDDSTATD